MKMDKRRFIPCALHHIYQRSADRGLLFYSVGDFIAYYTVFMTKAIKYGIQVYGLSLMYDHVHQMSVAPDAKTLGRFVGEVNCTYARLFNSEIGRKGALFAKGYGCAPRTKSKYIKSSLIYLFNNQVEKGLCKCAIDNRWNFLAYYFSPNPFSKKLIIRRASKYLRSAISIVKNIAENNRVISPLLFRNLIGKLDVKERDQLIDFIISTYSTIDYKTVISLWKSQESMLEAIDSTTGSEFDIGETIEKNVSDAVYPTIINCIRGLGMNAKDAIMLPDENKLQIARLVSVHISVPWFQICRVLHLEK